MGKLSLAAKITHVPSMYLSELPGKHHGCREAAIAGSRLLSLVATTRRKINWEAGLSVWTNAYTWAAPLRVSAVEYKNKNNLWF